MAQWIPYTAYCFLPLISLYKIRKNSIYTYCHCMGIRQQMAVNVDFVRKTNKAAFACWFRKANKTVFAYIVIKTKKQSTHVVYRSWPAFSRPVPPLGLCQSRKNIMSNNKTKQTPANTIISCMSVYLYPDRFYVVSHNHLHTALIPASHLCVRCSKRFIHVDCIQNVVRLCSRRACRVSTDKQPGFLIDARLWGQT